MSVQEKLYTAQDLWDISHRPENADKRFELMEGIIVEMSPAGGKHGGIALKLGRWIGNHVEDNELGYTTAAETGYILYTSPEGKVTVRAPDVGFVAAARLPDGLPDGYIPFAPDLAVEVVSPGDDAEEIQQKVMEYLQYGTRMVWVFYPKSRSVAVHTSAGAQTIGIDGTLNGGGVLPGFWLAIREIFS